MNAYGRTFLITGPSRCRTAQFYLSRIDLVNADRVVTCTASAASRGIDWPRASRLCSSRLADVRTSAGPVMRLSVEYNIDIAVFREGGMLEAAPRDAATLESSRAGSRLPHA